MSDPIDLVNEFFTYPPDAPPWPYMTPFDDFWGKRVAAFCERHAAACREFERHGEAASRLYGEIIHAAWLTTGKATGTPREAIQFLVAEICRLQRELTDARRTPHPGA